ncbi:MAG: hypothetical protein C5B51_13290 [Terriglobia bacterium]|nr:MAG: hypothetical protein C5B51_13290 [Terriglobia bacterium]
MERAVEASARERRGIANRALNGMQLPEMEALLGAIGAEREGRVPSALELAAKQAYEESLARECRHAGYASTKGLEQALDIQQAVTCVFAWRSPRGDLELTRRALEAQKSGRSPSHQEVEALQRAKAEWSRLARLTGLPLAVTAGDKLQ